MSTRSVLTHTFPPHRLLVLCTELVCLTQGLSGLLWNPMLLGKNFLKAEKPESSEVTALWRSLWTSDLCRLFAYSSGQVLV